jgi:hypothetical protein
MQLEAGEVQKGKWIINCLTYGNRLNGKFIITDKNVYYDIDNVYSATGIGGADGLIKFSRTEIAKVEAYSAFWIFKRFRITLKDGKEYVFDRGIMPTSPIVSLLK